MNGEQGEGEAHLVRVSVNLPDVGSRMVRSRTPFWRPMFTKVEGRFLSMLESTISAMQIEEDGAVRA